MNDDTVQPSNNDPNVTSGNDQPAVSPRQNSSSQSSDFDPVSTPHKETAPGTRTYENSDNVTEYFVKPSETEPQIDDKVKEAGVSPLSDSPTLKKDQIQAGVSLAKESTPAPKDLSDKVKLPMTSVEANRYAEGDSGSSLTWFANLVLFYLKKMGGPAREGKKNG